MEQSPLTPHLLLGQVWHKRFAPAVHDFTYPSYHIACPLDALPALPLARRAWRVLSFNSKDHGARDGRSLHQWANKLLKQYDVAADGQIILISSLRVFGYVFNPVSFWLCLDRRQNLRAVICEVNNTFGETHAYICAHKNARPITPKDTIIVPKKFHVSPFLQRSGHYRFRFTYTPKRFAARIDYYTGQGHKTLMTSLQGRLVPASARQLRRVAWRYPLASFLTIARIHWNALRLWLKTVPYISKPKPLAQKSSR